MQSVHLIFSEIIQHRVTQEKTFPSHQTYKAHFNFLKSNVYIYIYRYISCVIFTLVLQLSNKYNKMSIMLKNDDKYVASWQRGTV